MTRRALRIVGVAVVEPEYSRGQADLAAHAALVVAWMPYTPQMPQPQVDDPTPIVRTTGGHEDTQRGLN